MSGRTSNRRLPTQRPASRGSLLFAGVIGVATALDAGVRRWPESLRQSCRVCGSAILTDAQSIPSVRLFANRSPECSAPDLGELVSSIGQVSLRFF